MRERGCAIAPPCETTPSVNCAMSVSSGEIISLPDGVRVGALLVKARSRVLAPIVPHTASCVDEECRQLFLQ